MDSGNINKPDLVQQQNKANAAKQIQGGNPGNDADAPAPVRGRSRRGRSGNAEGTANKGPNFTQEAVKGSKALTAAQIRETQTKESTEQVAAIINRVGNMNLEEAKKQLSPQVFKGLSNQKFEDTKDTQLDNNAFAAFLEEDDSEFKTLSAQSKKQLQEGMAQYFGLPT